MLYFLLAFAATLFGSLTGMGGGIFIKPVLDFTGRQDGASIGVLSSATVFVMSVIALFRQRKTPKGPAGGMAIPLSAGAIGGGVLGEKLFALLFAFAPAGNVTVIQNAVLICLSVLVFVYMSKKSQNFSMPRRVSGAIPSVAAGMVLGLISSFLGIGGGPFNVALIVLVFGAASNTAMRCSLFTIAFSQAAKLITIVLFSNITEYDLSMLPAMIAGGAAGGFSGGTLSIKLSPKIREALFRAAQLVIIIICVLNIISSLRVKK